MSEARQKRRPRLSLLSLLLIVTVVALSLGIWRERQSTERYRRKIAGLQNEVGSVTVADPTKLTVQPLDDAVDSWRHFRWRAYTPPEHFGQVVATIWTDAEPQRQKRLTLRLDPGEMNFDFSVLQHPGADTWMYGLRQPLHRGGVSSGPAPPWIGGPIPVQDIFDRTGPRVAIGRGSEAELLSARRVNADGQTVEVRVVVRHLDPENGPKAVSSAGAEAAPVSAPSVMIRSEPFQPTRDHASPEGAAIRSPRASPWESGRPTP